MHLPVATEGGELHGAEKERALSQGGCWPMTHDQRGQLRILTKLRVAINFMFSQYTDFQCSYLYQVLGIYNAW